MALNERQSEGLGSVRDDIVEVISVNVRDLMEKLGQGHDETIAAIFKTRSGASAAISRTIPVPSPDDELLKTSVTYSHDGLAGASRQATTTAGFRTIHDVSDYNQKIQRALHFRGITERRSTIRPAYVSTFEWIWHHSWQPGLDNVKWDPLAPWLKAERPSKGGCYWLSGKAGSGKSSLLRYCERDTRLASYLKIWAGNAQLVISSFYFWYAGTVLQKSHAGLLRALLLDVLRARPELAAVLFPEISMAIISGSLAGPLELSPWELKAAFFNLVRFIPTDLRICFIVNGIDEYNGDYNELCELLLEVSKCTSIKVLASSRPIPVCCDRFRRCPGLRLQDLTIKDIHRYVTENLGNYHLMTRLERMEPGVTASIVCEVAVRASGVFLWVVVVVRNLIMRLQNYDSSATLINEISKLPPDLEKLYDHMLGSMSRQNRVLGSKFLQLVLRNSEIADRPYPFTLLQLSFAEEDDYEACLRNPYSALTEEAIEWRCESTEGRLRSSCCGLCEVGQSKGAVTFLHRTVVEFLQITANWDKLTQLTSALEFDADLALISSSVAELKAMPVKPRRRKPAPGVLTRMLRMLSFEKGLTEQAKNAFHRKYIPEMRKAVGYHWHNPQISKSPAQEVAAVEESYARTCQLLKLEYPRSIILSLGIQAADPELYRHIYQPYNNLYHPQRQGIDTANFMIHLASEPDGRIRLLMTNAVRSFGEDPMTPISVPAGQARQFWNDRWKQAVHKKDPTRPWSLWEFCLHYCYSIVNGTEDNGFNFLEPNMTISLLVILWEVLASQRTAAVATIAVEHRQLVSWSKEIHELSAWFVIMSCLHRIWSCRKWHSASEVHAVAELSCRIEDRLRTGGGAAQPEKTVSRPPLEPIAFRGNPRPERLRAVVINHRSAKLGPPKNTEEASSEERPRTSSELTSLFLPGTTAEPSRNAEAPSPWFVHTSPNRKGNASIPGRRNASIPDISTAAAVKTDTICASTSGSQRVMQYHP
jgi:hypothetical protein